MHNEILEKYIKDSKVLYIYEHGLQIYGLFSDIEDRDFIMIHNDDNLPDYSEFTETNEFGIYNFELFSIEKWFEEVLNGSIIAWECACLPKKYIYKEHVKLLLQTDPLGLRKEFDSKLSSSIKLASDEINLGNTLTGQKILWNCIKDVMFSNQIIENHKIIKFKEPLNVYKKIVDGQIVELEKILETFTEELFPHLDRFKKYTDNILAKSKLKFIKQND